MKKTILTLAVLLTLTVVAIAGDQDFLLVNETGLTIDELYISQVDTINWQEDVLGVDVLGDGEEVTVEFAHSEETCMWDIKIVDEDGDEIIWNEIDLCKAAKITLYYEDEKPVAKIE